MFKNSSPFTAWDVHYPVFSGTIYEQKHMFLPLYNHTKLCLLELDFKCRVFQFGTRGISSNIPRFIWGYLVMWCITNCAWEKKFWIIIITIICNEKFIVSLINLLTKFFPYDKNRKNWSQGYFFLSLFTSDSVFMIIFCVACCPIFISFNY